MFSRQALLRSARAAAPQRALLGQARSFAAASSEKVKPPVALFGLDGTYATALVRACPSPARPIARRQDRKRRIQDWVVVMGELNCLPRIRTDGQTPPPQ